MYERFPDDYAEIMEAILAYREHHKIAKVPQSNVVCLFGYVTVPKRFQRMTPIHWAHRK